MKRVFLLVAFIVLSFSFNTFSEEKSVGTFESVRIINVSGTVEAFYPNGEHKLLKAGGAIPQLTPAESGIMLRVMQGSITFEVTIIDEEGRVKYEELAFFPGDLTRITLSGPNQKGQPQWHVFSNINVSSKGQVFDVIEEGGSEFPDVPTPSLQQAPPPRRPPPPPPPPVSPFEP